MPGFPSDPAAGSPYHLAVAFVAVASVTGVVARTARHDVTAIEAMAEVEAPATFGSEDSRHMMGSAADPPSVYWDAFGPKA